MALIAQLGEHCTGIAEVVGSNPAQSLKIFSGLCSSSVTAALALMTVTNKLSKQNEVSVICKRSTHDNILQSTKWLSPLTQRKRQNSPCSIYEYSFITFNGEVFGMRRKTTKNILSFVYSKLTELYMHIHIQQQLCHISHSMVPNQKIKKALNFPLQIKH